MVIPLRSMCPKGARDSACALGECSGLFAVWKRGQFGSVWM